MDIIPWVEKYRPNKLNEINDQSVIINSLKNFLNTDNVNTIPHLIFHGPSGCGKTSTIIALCKELFKSHYKERVIELNASDERGINIIRSKIKNYAKQSINKINDIPNWKMIILDEADTMTSDSQFALRRIIEQYSHITRFCIICNYYNKIIEPIISRCVLFKFKSINHINILNKLNYICSKENYKCNDLILNKIISYSRGDLRKSINLLQKCHNINSIELTLNIINDISGILPNDLFNHIIYLIENKKEKELSLYIKNIHNLGYSLVNQILLFNNYILNNQILNDLQKSNLFYILCDIDQALIKGCDEYILYMKLIYSLLNIL
jgi:replication factor C subunit 2/4